MQLYNKLINLLFSKPKYYKIHMGPLRDIYLFMALRTGLRMYLGIYEKEQTSFMCKIIKKEDCCLDLGSHVGFFTMLFARLVGKDGKVFSFEPVKEGHNFQKKSVKKNRFSNIKLFNFALGDVVEDKKAYVFSDSGMARFDRSILGLEESQQTDIFQIRTLDSISEVTKLEKLDFMKIDIEGFEYRALLGGKNTIKKYKPNMLIEIHSRDNYEGIYSLLRELDYKLYDLENNKVDLKTDFGKKAYHIYVSTK